jgi:predicted nucleotide-binding protein
MKILIVDDNPIASGRVRGMLSTSKDMDFLVVSDPQFAYEIMDFGIAFDVALIDLRFANGSDTVGDHDGLGVCQKIRAAMPNVVIVGYSSSFSQDSDENRHLQDRFKAMGADIVCALDHLTLTTASELRYEFQAARERRSNGGRGVGRPKIFIGSSSERLEVANRIQVGLSSEFEPVVWNQAPFELSQMTMEALEKAIREFQFAIFVCTPDDKLESRGENKLVARDNVIFEAGLFIGSLGRSRTFVVSAHETGLILPSDLAGLTVAKFNLAATNMAAELGPACQQIKDAVNRVLKDDPTL